MLKVGTLVRLYGCLDRDYIGVIIRHNLHHNTYTIYWIKPQRITIESTEDVRKYEE